MTKNLDIQINKATVGRTTGIYLTINDRSSRKSLLEKYIPEKDYETYGFNYTIAFNAPGSEEK